MSTGEAALSERTVQRLFSEPPTASQESSEIRNTVVQVYELLEPCFFFFFFFFLIFIISIIWWVIIATLSMLPLTKSCPKRSPKRSFSRDAPLHFQFVYRTKGNQCVPGGPVTARPPPPSFPPRLFLSSTRPKAPGPRRGLRWEGEGAAGRAPRGQSSARAGFSNSRSRCSVSAGTKEMGELGAVTASVRKISRLPLIHKSI